MGQQRQRTVTVVAARRRVGRGRRYGAGVNAPFPQREYGRQLRFSPRPTSVIGPLSRRTAVDRDRREEDTEDPCGT